MVEEELGLRERKKRRTRVAIADVAMGLFHERGFDNVTVAEVAEAADVSVNTVFNYFRVKEDLFFDREAEAVEESSRVVRERRPGESAIRALRRDFLDALERDDTRSPLNEGMQTFARMVFESSALQARFWQMMRRREELLAYTLAEETDVSPEAVTPRVVAGQVSAVQRTLNVEVHRRWQDGQSSAQIRPQIRADAKQAFDLLESGIGDYCVRNGRGA